MNKGNASFFKKTKIRDIGTLIYVFALRDKNILYFHGIMIYESSDNMANYVYNRIICNDETASLFHIMMKV